MFLVGTSGRAQPKSLLGSVKKIVILGHTRVTREKGIV